MNLTNIFLQLGIALGLGLLVGLQREREASKLAGFRTFPLVTILGTVCALLAQSYGGWFLAAGLLGLTGMVVVGNIAKIHLGIADPGLTTEVAILLMYGVGAYLVMGRMEVAIAVGGGVMVLLQLKGELHGFAARMGDNDLKAIMRFVLISLVILPVLPNRAYGPYLVLNPQHIWLMVALIVGISLGGYVIYKFMGEQAGVVLGGLLGGMISSTATTVSYARRTARLPAGSNLAAVAILIASTVAFFRILLEIALVAPAFLSTALPPILVLLLVLGAFSLVVWFLSRREHSQMPEQDNPTELKSALFFGLVYASVLFAVAAAKERFGSSGLYVVAVLSGLTDMDAITLSTSRLVSDGRLADQHGWRLIMAASISNLIFKAGVVAVLAHRHLLSKIAGATALALLTGVLLMVFWPGL